MIEVNLNKANVSQLPSIMGMDLNKLNPKWLLVAILFYYIPGFFVAGTFSSNLNTLQGEITTMNRQLGTLRAKSNKTANIQKEIDVLNERKNKLNERLQAVREVMESRKNPYKIFSFIQKEIPAEVWFETIGMEKDIIKIEVRSKFYRKIGEFIDRLKEGVFFKNDGVRIDKYETASDKDGDTVETAEISLDVARYN
jgi:Tfp pilus assembly protein PilN